MSAIRMRPTLPGDAVRREAARAGGYEHVCRFCAKDVDKRRGWHKKCAEVYKAGIFRREQVLWLLRRQQGSCALCQTMLGEVYPRYEYLGRTYWKSTQTVHVDHVVPLWRVALMPVERRVLRWWLPGNLQALCEGCHKEKTRLEAAERARERRGNAQLEIGVFA